jgi:hypothetical protein
MASHATTSNAAHARQARQERLLPTGIGSKHNVGHLYYAKPALLQHYQQLDPCNCFNPGIGHTSKWIAYKEPRQAEARIA